MKKVILVALAALSMSTSALALDVNPLVGFQLNAETDIIGAEPVSPVIGAELIMDSNWLVGASLSANSRDDLYATNGYAVLPVEVENTTVSVWGGKIFDNNFALKAGMSVLSSEMTSPYAYGSVSGTQTHLMVGTGYYFNNGLNVSMHLNVPVAGDTYGGTELADYTNMQVLMGYRF